VGVFEDLSQHMRAAAIFGLGTSPRALAAFRAGSRAEWTEGVPGSPDGADAVLLFGGDGTIHRHLPALVRLGRPVLVVPAGSGNDLARSLRLFTLQDSIRAWRDFEAGAGNVQAIDLGTITERQDGAKHYFSCVAGCGLDGAVSRRANRMPRWLRRHGGYVLALIPTVLRPAPVTLRLNVLNGDRSGERSLPLLLAAFANTPFYGDGMRLAPLAKMDDGKLDLCLIHPLHRLKLLGVFPSVYFGRHVGIDEFECWRTKKVLLDSATPQDIFADGEYVCRTPVEIGVAPGALRVIAPPVPAG